MHKIKTIEVDEDTQIVIGHNLVSGDYEVQIIWDGGIVRRARTDNVMNTEIMGRRLAYEFMQGDAS